MPIVLDGTQGVSTPMYAGSISSNPVTPSVNMKNRIINGSMVIDQRNAGASVTPTTTAYTLDRWKAGVTQSSKFSVQQTTTAPAGFNNSLKVTSLAATSVGAADYYTLVQAIEGYNIADLGFGTANAKTITVSFWVQSSLTGTFGGALTSASDNDSYPFTYTISAANTWEYKTVTVAGNTTGTWLTTNGVGLNIYFGLGVGSGYSGTVGTWTGNAFKVGTSTATSVVGTNGATFYITGVQLEVGSTATSFDYRPYGTELQLCQRYFEKSYDTGTAVGTNTSTGAVYNYASTDQYSSLVASVPFKVEKRAAPTMTGYQTGGTSGSWAYGRSGATGTATVNFYDTGTSRFTQYMTIGASAYASAYCVGHWTASAEL